MITQTPSKIFKYDFREWIFSESVTESTIFEEKGFQIKEVLLEAKSSYHYIYNYGKELLLIPLFGDVVVNEKQIFTNSIFIFKNKEISKIFIENNSENTINFLIVELKGEQNKNVEEVSEIMILRNGLSKMIPNLSIQNYIGIFDGREEISLGDFNKSSKIFALVLHGAFEFQNRLLETRDALVIWDIEEIEMESLSENALILIFEIP